MSSLPLDVRACLSDATDTLCYDFDEDDEPHPDDPKSFADAMNRPDKLKWVDAIKDELKSIKDLEVYKLVDKSEAVGRRILRGKFVFHIKRDEHGAIERYKVRFVVGGDRAVPGVDYAKTTSPTMRLETFRIILHVAAAMGWAVHQVDVKTAFLRGSLPPGTCVYMHQPKGFEVLGFEDWIWQLQKGLYGLPDAGRIWNKEVDDAMVAKFKWIRVPCEHCLYYRDSGTGKALVGVHVDDFCGAMSNDDEAARFKSELLSLWEIKDLGIAKFCLGIGIERDLANHHIFISQTALIDKTLALFLMTDCNAVTTPMEPKKALTKIPLLPLSESNLAELKTLPYRRLVGLLMYIAIGTRPDIALAVQKLCQFLSCYNYEHWEAAKRLLRYLKGTRELRLRLGGPVIQLTGFTDASFACCPDTRRSVGAYCFTLGNSGVISWSARKQKTVAQSTTDSEYIACAESAREAVWIRSVLTCIGLAPQGPTPLSCDNEAARILSEDQVFHSRSKHIDIRYHYIRECCKNGSIIVRYVRSEENVADILTKPLAAPQFVQLRSFLGLHERI